MAVTFGGISGREDGGTTDATHSFSFDAGSGSGRTIVVDIFTYDTGAAITPSTVTFNSVGLSLAKEVDYNFGGARHLITSSWQLGDPASGSNTVAVTLSGTPNSDFWVVARYYTGANNGIGANTASAIGNISDHEYDNTGTDTDALHLQNIGALGRAFVAGTGFTARLDLITDPTEIHVGDEDATVGTDTVGGDLTDTDGTPSVARSVSGVFELLPGAAAISVDVPTAALVITGYAPTVNIPWAGTVPLATLVITGQVPTVDIAAHISVDVPLATLVITGYAPTPGWSGGVTVPYADDMYIYAYAPTVDIPWSGTVPLATLVITGYVPTAATPVAVEVPLATLVITGYAPTVVTPVDVEIPLATLVITGQVPDVAAIAGVDIDVPTAALVITGLAPAVGWSGGTTVPLATLVITGLAPEIQAGGSISIDVPLATLVITGLAPSVDIPWAGTVPLSTIVITGYAPAVDIPWAGTVPLATLVITGQVPTVAATANIVIGIPVAALVIAGYVPTIAAGAGADVTVPIAAIIITAYVVTAVTSTTVDVVGSYPRGVTMVGPPPADVSFPAEKFYTALDNEARKMRTVVNQAYKEAEEEAEELKRQARYARDEALAEIYSNLRVVNQRMDELKQSKTDIRSMQMRRRLEDARTKKPLPQPKPKKRKDMRPKLTQLKKKQYKKKR